MKIAVAYFLLFFVCFLMAKPLLAESSCFQHEEECNEANPACCSPFSLCSCGLVWLVNEPYFLEFRPNSESFIVFNSIETQLFPTLESNVFWHPPKQL